MSEAWRWNMGCLIVSASIFGAVFLLLLLGEKG